MTANDTIVELMKRHVLWDDEPVVRVRNWPDGLALTTEFRHFVAGSSAQADWLIGAEDWVEDIVVATRDDLMLEGQRERFGFLLRADGSEVYLNDRAAVADLGRRLADGMDPVAYAEILVQLHPYSSAIRSVLVAPDQLRKIYRQQDLPIIETPAVRQSPDGLHLTFVSSSRYRRPGGAPLLDLTKWSVRVPADGPATWTSLLSSKGIQLDPFTSHRAN
jgi:hypothetical protein